MLWRDPSAPQIQDQDLIADCQARSLGFDRRGHVFFAQKEKKQENKGRTLLSGYYVGEGLVLFYFLFL